MLGLLAIFTLPHQFHVGVVECQDERHLRIARCLFPLYMLLIALPILPLAREGQAKLAALGVRSVERRVGKECVSTCRSRWSPYLEKKSWTEIVCPFSQNLLHAV